MSASRTPTVAPSAANASARFTAVVDFPTPPLPLATATMFLTPGTSLTPRWTACETTRVPIVHRHSADTWHRGDGRVTSLRSDSCWLFAGIAEGEVDGDVGSRHRDLAHGLLRHEVAARVRIDDVLEDGCDVLLGHGMVLRVNSQILSEFDAAPCRPSGIL